jgi:hypothetical protein
MARRNKLRGTDVCPQLDHELRRQRTPVDLTLPGFRGYRGRSAWLSRERSLNVSAGIVVWWTTHQPRLLLSAPQVATQNGTA